MSKVYKGYELIKAIANGEIKEGSRFIDTYTTPDYGYFAEKDNGFELIEDETIDIDNIEKLDIGIITTEDRLKINELVQAVKQINKKIEKEK